MRHRLSFFIHVHRSGRASVVARLTSPAFRKIDCSVGPLVGDWDRDRQRAKAASREAANLNLRLAEIERGVEAFFTRADLDGRQPAREEAARALRELCGGAAPSPAIWQTTPPPPPATRWTTAGWTTSPPTSSVEA